MERQAFYYIKKLYYVKFFMRFLFRLFTNQLFLISTLTRDQAWRYSCFAGCWYYCYRHVCTRSSAGATIKAIITTAVGRSTVLACRRITWPPWRTRPVSARPSSAEWRRRCRRRRRRWGRTHHRHLITSPSWYRRCHLRSRTRRRRPVTTRYAMKSPDQRETQRRTRPKNLSSFATFSCLHLRSQGVAQINSLGLGLTFTSVIGTQSTITHRQHNGKSRGLRKKKFARLYFLVGIIVGERGEGRGEEPRSATEFTFVVRINCILIFYTTRYCVIYLT